MAFDTHLRTELVTGALLDAIARRDPSRQSSTPIEPARYMSHKFRSFCRTNSTRPSAGATGICFDNSVAESFFATLKKELIHGHRWATVSDLRIALFQFIEGYYNRHRRHSTINYRTPEEKGNEYAELTLTAA